MSYAIPQTSLAGLTAGQTGTVDWTSVAQSIGFPDPSQRPHIQFYNESPCELQLNMQTGEQFVLPAGGWQTIELNPNCTHASFQVIAVLNASPIVALLLGTWYAPGETVPAAPILGNSPIGGSITNTIAQILQGANQFYGVTELDQANEPMLIPVIPDRALYLSTTDVNGSAVIGIEMQKSSLSIPAGRIDLLMPVGYLYNAGFLAGQGLPGIVATYGPTVITSTAFQTLIDYTPLTNGLYRASIGVALNNGTSGQAVLADVTYTAASAAGAHRFAAIQTGVTTVTVLDGVISHSNGDYACMPHAFYATTGGHIQIGYRDPANTPNDTVSAIIERLV